MSKQQLSDQGRALIIAANILDGPRFVSGAESRLLAQQLSLAVHELQTLQRHLSAVKSDAPTTDVRALVENPAKSVVIGGKVSDMCHAGLYDKDGNLLEEHNGYVPQIGCFDDGEDYFYVEVDNATGVVKNWKPIVTFKVEEVA